MVCAWRVDYRERGRITMENGDRAKKRLIKRGRQRKGKKNREQQRERMQS